MSKLHPADFLATYNWMGVRFRAEGERVIAYGPGVAPALAKCVEEKSAELLPWLDMQVPEEIVSRETKPTVQPATLSDGERLYHKGLQGARRNAERKAAIVDKARRKAVAGR